MDRPYNEVLLDWHATFWSWITSLLTNPFILLKDFRRNRDFFFHFISGFLVFLVCKTPNGPPLTMSPLLSPWHEGHTIQRDIPFQSRPVVFQKSRKTAACSFSQTHHHLRGQPYTETQLIGEICQTEWDLVLQASIRRPTGDSKDSLLQGV